MSVSTQVAKKSHPGRGLQISLILNLVLLAASFLASQRLPLAPSPPDRSGTSPVHNLSKGPNLRQTRIHSKSTPAEPTPWSRLESEDLATYASNLRAAGCPAETVCDILRPEFRRRMELDPLRVLQHTNFWLQGRQRLAWQQAEKAAIRERRRTDRKRLRELDCGPMPLAEFEEFKVRNLVDMFAGFMPTERRTALFQIMEDREDFLRDWRDQTQGVVLDADRAEYQTVAEALHARILTEVGLAEFEELSLRVYTTFREPSEINQLAMTSEELRKLLHLRFLSGDFDVIHEIELPKLPGEDSPQKGNESDQRANDRAILGETREAEYHRLYNPYYSQMDSWSKAHNLDSNQSGAILDALEESGTQIKAVAAKSRNAPDDPQVEVRGIYIKAHQRLTQLLATVPPAERAMIAEKWLNEVTQEAWKSP